MQLANQEAQRLNHEYLGCEHILIGIVKEGSGVACTVLRNLGIEPGQLLPSVRDSLIAGSNAVMTGRLPLVPSAKRVIEMANTESAELQHNYVGTEHVLLGLLKAGDLGCSKVFSAFGINRSQVLAGIRALLGHPPESDSPSILAARWQVGEDLQAGDVAEIGPDGKLRKAVIASKLAGGAG